MDLCSPDVNFRARFYMDLYSPPVNSRLGMEVPSGPVFCMHEFQGENITSKSDICSQTREVPNGRVFPLFNSRRYVHLSMKVPHGPVFSAREFQAEIWNLYSPPVNSKLRI